MVEFDEGLYHKKISEVNNILKKAEHGMHLVNESLDILEDAFSRDSLGDNLKNIIKNQFVKVRGVTLEFCDDIEGFDFKELIKFKISKDKIENWEKKRKELVDRCSLYRDEAVINEFTSHLDNLAKVWKDNSQRAIEESIVYYYFSEAGSIFEKGSYLFGDVLKELKALKKD